MQLGFLKNYRTSASNSVIAPVPDSSNSHYQGDMELLEGARLYGGGVLMALSKFALSF